MRHAAWRRGWTRTCRSPLIRTISSTSLSVIWPRTPPFLARCCRCPRPERGATAGPTEPTSRNLRPRRRNRTYAENSRRRRKCRPKRNHWSVVYDDGEEGRIDLEAAVIFDEAKLLELVHEGVHAGPRRPHHLGECFLRDSRQPLWLVILAIAREQQKGA